MVVALALLSAFFFALAAALQQRAALREKAGVGLLATLVRRPLWLTGLATDAVGGILQALALGAGRLAVVEPLTAATVVFALPLGRRLTGQVVGRREVIAAVLVMAGLAAFLLIAEPGAGRADAPVGQWLIAGAGVAVLAAVLTVAGLRGPERFRAATRGAASGTVLGLCAALTKAVVEQATAGGPEAVFTDWHVYALAVTGVLAIGLDQQALRAGQLAPAVAASMIADPLVGVVLGVTLLDERLHETALTLVGCLLAFGVMATGLTLLARPVEEPARPEPPPIPRPRGSPPLSP